MIEVKNLLDDLICEYHVEDEVGSPATASLNGNGDDFLSSISARVASRRPISMGFRSELDRYLDEEMVNMQQRMLMSWCLHQNLGRRMWELETSKMVSSRNRLHKDRY